MSQQITVTKVKDYIGIIVVAVGLVSNIAVSQYQIGELKTNIEKLNDERDGFIRLQTQQEELNKKVDVLTQQNSEMYKMVYTIYSNR